MPKRETIEELQQENELLRATIKRLEAEVVELKAVIKGMLKQDSHNSHQPPSQDKQRYPKMKFEDKEAKAEKQKRERETLEFSEDPDNVEQRKIDYQQCACGRGLAEQASHWERVQVIDVPELRLEVTEYQRERKRCQCGKLHEALLPEGIYAGVQYGPRSKGLLSYWHQYQHLPLGRCVESFQDLFGQGMSEGSLLKSQARLYEELAEAEQEIIGALKQSPDIHGDETGLFVKQQNHWLHVRSNAELTFYHIDKSRGSQAHKSMGIFADYQGRMVHDCHGSYFTHQGQHVICHSHTIRELLSVFEATAQAWAYDLAQLLWESNCERGKLGLSLERQVSITTCYLDLLVQAQDLNPERPRPQGHKGRVKQSKAFNLIKRLLNLQDAALLFLTDPAIPFTNNQAERDLRMMKLKQKISGGFQSQQSPKHFCRIRGYISTLRKQGLPVLEALTEAFRGRAVLPRLPTSLLEG